MKVPSVVLALAAAASAMPDIFEQFFQQGHQQQHHQQQQQQQNTPSDSNQYISNYMSLPCTNYLCPGTLACVHFPHHCPCAFPDIEDKVELDDGIAICASKGGYKPGEMARKVELARKGLL